MSITKRLIDLMNGEIIVDSVPGKGSVFTVRLPQKRASSEVCGKELADKLRKFSFHRAEIMKKMRFFREYMPYGSVLVVDDVESNIYVAKGMMLPYGLKLDTARSGFEAIDKIKNGNVYDILFMDHMMPKMDGIEAVKIIRDMGYTQPIIALTANALLGRAKMFLENGFDNFLPKPIDSRELDLILIEFIKDRKPPEVVEAARRMPAVGRLGWQSQACSGEDTKGAGIKYFFVRDAENAVKNLENTAISDSEMESYIITVHGMKSALANIGEKELSGIAFNLEDAARRRDLELLTNETPSFIHALKSLVAKLKSIEDNTNDIADKSSGPEENSDLKENRIFLHKKLIEIKTACAALDKKSAKTALNDLKAKTWPRQINIILNDITAHLLHSEFTEITELVDKFVH